MIRQQNKAGRKWVMLIGLVLLLMLLVGVPANASTTGPTYSALSPANLATVTTANPLVKVHASDTDGINGASLKFYLNNQIKTANLTQPKTWVMDPDTGALMEAVNKNEADISYQAANLSDGNQTVQVQVYDDANNVSVTQWSFTVAVPPVIANLTPADNSGVLTNSPTISAIVKDPNGSIDPATIILTVNSTRVAHNFNSATGEVSYTPAIPLTSGSHNVTLEAKDMGGHVVIAAWRFNVTVTAPVFSNLSPADGSIITVNNPLIQVNVSDTDELDANSLSMKIGAQVVQPTITFNTTWASDGAGNVVQVQDLTKGKITYQANGLGFGPYPLEISIKDKLGTGSTSNTTFNIDAQAVAPLIMNLTPAPKSYVTNQRPGISANISASAAIDPARIELIVNGIKIPAFIYTATGTTSGNVYYMPGSNLTNEIMHNVAMTVYDVNGVSGKANWSFYVTTNLEMQGSLTSQECLGCHTIKTHRVDRCQSCHDGDANACLRCHSVHGAEVITNFRKNDCFSCHARDGYIANWTKGHDIAGKHTVANSCGGDCHAGSLTREHEKYTDPVTQSKYNCATCHSNTRPEIINAIKSLNTSCGACHGQAHNVNFVEKIPLDIPLHSGFDWTVPLPAAIWGGETWMPVEYSAGGGKIVISSRRNDISTVTAAAYYQEQLNQFGWTMSSPVPDTTKNYFSMTFTKVNRICTVLWYKGETHTATTPLPAGGRFEILYK